MERYEDEIPGPVIEEISGLMVDCFGEAPQPNFSERVAEKLRPMVLIACVDGEAVGFKLGYEKNREEFFSWLGGVRTAFRRNGIARDLLRAQHQWCAERGYRAVLTESANEYRAMLMLDLSEGFEIEGTRTYPERGLRVLMRKRLSAGSLA
jgi:GNAT superfamily N-acetyltransferase